MAIYTRFGTRVTFVDAQLLPVWIEHRGSEIKWHYREPRTTKRTKEVTEMPIWFVTALSIDDRPDHGPRGRWICDGKGVCANEFKADDGSIEIERRCQDLNPQHMLKFSEWNKADGPKASELFSLANEDQIA